MKKPPGKKEGTWVRRMKELHGHANRRVKQLRRNATKAEKELVRLLDVYGIVYRFQRPVCNQRGRVYVVDFWFPRGERLPLVVEVDGGYHDDAEQAAFDADRTEDIRRTTGAEVIRFKNRQVFEEPDVIFGELAARGVMQMKPEVFTYKNRRELK